MFWIEITLLSCNEDFSEAMKIVMQHYRAEIRSGKRKMEKRKFQYIFISVFSHAYECCLFALEAPPLDEKPSADMASQLGILWKKCLVNFRFSAPQIGEYL